MADNDILDPVHDTGAPLWASVAAAAICSLDGVRDSALDDSCGGLASFEGHIARIMATQYDVWVRCGRPDTVEEWNSAARREAKIATCPEGMER